MRAKHRRAPSTASSTTPPRTATIRARALRYRCSTRKVARQRQRRERRAIKLCVCELERLAARRLQCALQTTRLELDDASAHANEVGIDVGDEEKAAAAQPTATSVGALEKRASHRRYESLAERDMQRAQNGAMPATTATAFKECRSASAFDDFADAPETSSSSSPRKRLLSHIKIDPITQDVERRMSMKDHYSTRSSSHSGGDIATREHSVHTLQLGQRASALLRSYSNLATTFVRGAYQRARGAVSGGNGYVRVFFYFLPTAQFHFSSTVIRQNAARL